eukprot:SAG31_NODE_34781_length_329_cov_1.043478_1_plen_37_part_10
MLCLSFVINFSDNRKKSDAIHDMSVSDFDGSLYMLCR